MAFTLSTFILQSVDVVDLRSDCSSTIKVVPVAKMLAIAALAENIKVCSQQGDYITHFPQLSFPTESYRSKILPETTCKTKDTPAKRDGQKSLPAKATIKSSTALVSCIGTCLERSGADWRS